jgi:acyl carrier protein
MPRGFARSLRSTELDKGQEKIMAISHDEVYKKVQGVLVDALGVDEEEVTPDAVIKDDLGAESIDFLDISFRLEKAFAIKIGKGEMMPDLSNNAELAQNGKVTPAGIVELKKRMPHSDFTEFEKNPTVDNMSKLFTVKTIVGYVEGKLANV